MFEPLDTMAETTLALCSGDPAVLTGRIAFSLQLLVELKRPVLDLHGERLVDGWQPADLPRSSPVRRRTWPSRAGRQRTLLPAARQKSPTCDCSIRVHPACRAMQGCP